MNDQLVFPCVKKNCFRPFREINVHTNSKSWDRVYALEKGNVYVEVREDFFAKELIFSVDLFQGNLTNLVEMKHWTGNDVLYIGDHIYGDLAVSLFDRRTELIEICCCFSFRICF